MAVSESIGMSVAVKSAAPVEDEMLDIPAVALLCMIESLYPHFLRSLLILCHSCAIPYVFHANVHACTSCSTFDTIIFTFTLHYEFLPRFGRSQRVEF